MNFVVLIVTLVNPGSSSHTADLNVSGEYKVFLAEGVLKAQAADAALDYFHENVPVKMPEAFEFSVQTEEGETLECDFGNGSYSSQSLAYDISKS